MSSVELLSALAPSNLIRNLTISRAFLGLIAFFALRFVVKAVYRLYFHPLRNFPGPKLYAITQIPMVSHVYRGTYTDMICGLHQKYGKVVRVSPHELSFNDPRGWKDIHGHQKPGKANIIKHPDWFVPAINDVHTIISANDEDHSRMRRIFSNAFSDKSLKLQEGLFAKYADLLIHKMKEVSKDPKHQIDMVRMYNYTTFDIMSDLTFGEPLYLLDNDDYIPWVKNIFESIRTGSKIGIVRYWPSVMKFVKAIAGNAAQKKRVIHFDYSSKRVDRRVERGSNEPDIWNLVMNAKEGRGLTKGEMYANTTVFMIAGTETTATLLSGVTWYLLKHQDSLKKLVDEIRGAFKSDDDITIEGLQRLKYLRACLEEGLRMYPPVPIGLPCLVPAQGSEVCGEWIPGGTTVSCQQLAMYQDPKNFVEPLSFIPERWTGEDDRFDGDNKHALQPFSYGPRNCLGKNLAYHEMRIILAKILFHFDLTLEPESDSWRNQEVYTLWQKPALKVKCTPVRA
ncbi:cytochrome P450 [Aaosphaeria arxii CBS 175.79]|uniref:Cytochrome P450 n=1 Tax=Aaosphaeria arxii CBS 175.79 TaxID=1450172 RepID=A0A6A5XMT4_9PLEO|nr:cytochrome P450 [Aaosphaeria arxii CBS 175.79]KAF2014226.1 cytochrome P450 [Aaosphaeria arxii CBS 175.79]